jgi:flagellar M-ring protein FliF
MLANLMDQFNKIWQDQSQTQRTIMISVIVIIIILVPTLIVLSNQPTYGVAFSNLNATDAGNIVAKLQTENINYQLRDGNTILVPTDRVYDVRLMMATEGLPKGGSVGFELFDTNTLGMTEFTQRVTYQRALEGELERTISSMDAVAAVRVHIVTPEKSLLTSEQSPTTASVTIQEANGQMINAAQIQSITYLVANSVEGLDVQNVVIVDTEGNLLATGTGDSGYGSAISQSDSRRATELSAAKAIELKVKNMLNTALGPNRSVVQVYVNMDWTEKEITSETFEATPIVRSESIISEIYTTDMSELSGIPGATSNLPATADTVDAETAEGEAPIYQRNEAVTNYELSSVQSHEIVYPGEISRVSLSVLVDGVTDDAQLGILQEAIVAAAGIDPNRGDLVSVQSLTFDRSYEESSAETLAVQENQEMIFRIVQIAGVGLLLLMVFWYISRLLKNLKMASVEVWTPVLQPVSQISSFSAEPERIMFTHESQTGEAKQEKTEEKLPEKKEEKQPKIDIEKIVKEKIQVPTPEEEQMTRLVNRVAEENPASIAEIIQMWLSQDRTND